MVVIDTNILAYLLIEGDQTKQARALFAQDSEWHSEAFILIEFSNIIATYQRTGDLTQTQAERLLRQAETLMRGLIDVPHIAALQTARKFSVSAYDARFLVAADSLSERLVTADARLRDSAPGLTQSLVGALAS